MTDKVLGYLKQKLENIPELRAKNSALDNPEFDKWIQDVITACGRISKEHKTRAENLSFSPFVLSGGDDDRSYWQSSYQSGLNYAESFIKSIIEELETWGAPGDISQSQIRNKAVSTIINLTISQQQSQQIIQSINLSDYNSEIKEKVTELLDELEKTNKDKTKIKDTVKWLADKSVDVLIAILLNQVLPK